MICNDCPRNCGVDLDKNKGFCGKDGKNIKVAKVMRHFWEEPIISGKNGSGAIFLSFCSLKCLFCQNYEISHLGKGRDFSINGVSEILKLVDKSKAENINFVTPTHYTSEIIECLKIYKPKKPIVWNCSGYEQNLERLKNVVDIFLFDFKYFDDELAFKCSKVKNYFDVCLKALKKAREIVGEDIVENGIMKRGIIIRHLVLPGFYSDSIKIFEKIKNELGTNFYVSVMSQYTPYYKAKNIKELNTKLRPIEYKKVVNKILSLGFNKGFIQELSSANTNFTPQFIEEKFFELWLSFKIV